ncbi:hypothetical protein N9S81_00090 [bacterium]|nr:hypothetical protein [bacterium]
MIFTDPLADASSPNELFDLILARCFRGACCTEACRLDGFSWYKFFQVHILVLEQIQRCPADKDAPCLYIRNFSLQHPDNLFANADKRYAVLSLPRHQVTVVVCTDMSWWLFGAGAETMKLILQSTPMPTVPVIDL